jgi:hypothetical protein
MRVLVVNQSAVLKALIQLVAQDTQKCHLMTTAGYKTPRQIHCGAPQEVRPSLAGVRLVQGLLWGRQQLLNGTNQLRSSSSCCPGQFTASANGTVQHCILCCSFCCSCCCCCCTLIQASTSAGATSTTPSRINTAALCSPLLLLLLSGAAAAQDALAPSLLSAALGVVARLLLLLLLWS